MAPKGAIPWENSAHNGGVHNDFTVIMDNTVGSRGFMLINERQRQIITGTILGDGHLEKNGRNVRLRIEHSLLQKEYLLWKFQELRDIVAGMPRIVGTRDNRSGKTYRRWHISTYSLFELNEYRRIFYRNGSKIVPSDIVDMLKSPLSLAVWFMDDGYKRNDCAALRLSTDAYKRSEQMLLIDSLYENFGIKTKLHQKGKWFNIYVAKDEAKKFCDMIRPFVIPLFQYKLL